MTKFSVHADSLAEEARGRKLTYIKIIYEVIRLISITDKKQSSNNSIQLTDMTCRQPPIIIDVSCNSDTGTRFSLNTLLINL